MTTPATVKVPRRFFDDHAERDLPTPTIVRTLAAHYVVSSDDPALSELLNDAEHYATPGQFGHDPELAGIVASARATVRALKAPAQDDTAAALARLRARMA